MRTPEDIETDPDGLIRLGAVASVDLAAARCTVKFDDETETPPLRWIEPRMGKTRCWSPPSEGEQVVLLCPAGELGGAVVLRGLVCDAFAAPDDRKIDLVKFEDGATISYDADAHELSITLPAGATTQLVSDGGITITGDITLEGDVDMTGTLTASGDVVASGISLNSHTHGSVRSGSDSSGGPQ